MRRRRRTTNRVPPAVDELAPALLRITARGFEPNTTGFIEQCTVAGCAEPVPRRVRRDRAGATPVPRRQRVRPPSPRRRRASRRVALRRASARATTSHISRPSFAISRAPPAPSRSGPTRGLDDGAPVRVSVTGFYPGEQVRAKLCRGPAHLRPDPLPCTRPRLVVHHRRRRCGTDCARGPRGSRRVGRCVVRSRPNVRHRRVSSDVVDARARSADLFAAGPATRYDPFRWLTGMAVALALLALAFLLADHGLAQAQRSRHPDLDRAAFID